MRPGPTRHGNSRGHRRSVACPWAASVSGEGVEVARRLYRPGWPSIGCRPRGPALRRDGDALRLDTMHAKAPSGGLVALPCDATERMHKSGAVDMTAPFLLLATGYWPLIYAAICSSRLRISWVRMSLSTPLRSIWRLIQSRAQGDPAADMVVGIVDQLTEGGRVAAGHRLADVGAELLVVGRLELALARLSPGLGGRPGHGADLPAVALRLL